ncbi:MAG: hypothetical protein A2675_02125 [Candidatus Yonathbacteria bacterium RIFCSPHIGHO2_01_FULL_51_10]|uniref:Uncharacterized protein n=1 Tax=Candidatus Yonathbacteria bacterium RIFCSPHIGHO2_01_FULL_51_10 TaxID=1802723 RepID=A0A1G2SA65_9BACT|nr:MAG: hypothetical protein A2675_02125 [Candidatus Yonathbacteria bacterium RIFCSPHIGHO2_01_FULL_51_10]
MIVGKQTILDFARQKGVLRSREAAEAFGVSRQYMSRVLAELVEQKALIKIGSTRSAIYVLEEFLDRHPELAPHRYAKRLMNVGLEEHKVLEELERRFPPFNKLPENIKSIFTFAFSEMLNNAIEHSESKVIHIAVSIENDTLTFVVDDFGIGVYRNIMKKRGLKSELEAIQDLLKGKITTAPKLHSGEGIFFTSKAGDEFILDSYGYKFIANNTIPDIFVKKTRGQKQGTKVTFRVSIKNTSHLNDVFKKYINQTEDSDYGFDKTEIRVRLYIVGGVYISRSQARRVLTGLEKFKIIVMDYDRVPMVGQAFADEVYRVFARKHPEIKIEDINMNDAVKFMVERARNEAAKVL